MLMYHTRHPLTLVSIALLALAILLVTTPALGAPPLHAPWTCGEVYPVSQSHKTGSHVGKGTWSWDFAMPVGTPVVAPAGGVVRKVRQDSTRHGCNSSYAYDANYVILAFQDGTEALFLHLEANSVPLSVGDRVRAGDTIGRVGMSGWTCGPHLHFQVQTTCDSWWCASTPASFAKWGDPVTGAKLTSANCTQATDEPQRASYSPEDPEHATGGQAPACYAP
jgi:murein DD-endopeptidase MepM/ murein hydrolase activator NlpD